jgi:hypothetical protein
VARPDRYRQRHPVHYPGGQNTSDQLQDPPVTDPFPQALKNKIMSEPVEEAIDVGV